MKKTHLIFLYFFILLVSVVLAGCQVLELTEIIFEKRNTNSKTGSVIFRPYKSIELKENAQADYSSIVVFGDDVNNNQIKGLLVFDTEKLLEHKIQSASIIISKTYPKYGPSFGEEIIIENIDSMYFDGKSLILKKFPIKIFSDLSFSNNKLKDSLKEAIEEGREKYYLRFCLHKPTNNDNVEDLIIIRLEDVSLKVNYTDN